MAVPRAEMHATIGAAYVGATSARRYDADAPALQRLLSPAEVARAERYRSPEKSLEFIVGRAATRCALASWTGVAPEAIVIEEDQGTKPRLVATADASSIDFNVTHSAGQIALAMARGRRIGVDIEQVRPINHEPRFAEMILSAREFDAYERLAADVRLGWLLAAWTAKEAYLKGVGRGLAESLPAVEALPPLDGVMTFPAGKAWGFVEGTVIDGAKWQFHRLEAAEGFLLTLAAETTSEPVVVLPLDLDGLLAAATAERVGGQ